MDGDCARLSAVDVRKGLLELRRRWFQGRKGLDAPTPIRLTEAIGIQDYSVASFALETLMARYRKREEARKRV